LSPITFAEAIDALAAAGRAFVAEGEGTVTVSGLSAADADALRAQGVALGWPQELFDREQQVWAQAPEQDFAPFRLVLRKPAAAPGTLRLLTDTAFAAWLERGHPAPHWEVARLAGAVVAQARVCTPWDAPHVMAVMPPATKSPRALVREYGEQRSVPADIRPWLAEPLSVELFATPTVQVWARAAATVLLLSLGDELDPYDGAIRFRGPPRLQLPPPPAAWNVADTLGHAGFQALQDAAHWVFENEREAEMRHILLATELVRSGSDAQDTPRFLREHLAAALEGAQIAYQVTLADASRDTLRLLADLRKAVTEETGKLSDLNRQLMASVASALTLGVGLVAARVMASASPILVAAVMAVAAIYVLMVIVSGFQFIALQRQLRAEWQPRLYRFLSLQDYTRMVAGPAARAERAFRLTALLGGIAVLALAFVCAWPLLNS
jgi:hypothetical protein